MLVVVKFFPGAGGGGERGGLGHLQRENKLSGMYVPESAMHKNILQKQH